MALSAQKRRCIRPSVSAFAMASSDIPAWWANTARTVFGASPQRSGVQSTASQKPHGPRAPSASSARRLRIAA